MSAEPAPDLEELRRAVHAELTRSFAICIALTASIPALALLLAGLVRGTSSHSGPPESPLGAGLGLAGLLLAGGSQLYRKRLHAAPQLQRLAASLTRVSVADALLGLMTRLRRPHLLLFALHEVVALVGFGLALAERSFALFVPFAALALLLDAALFPSFERWLDLARLAFPATPWPSPERKEPLR